MFFWKSTFQLWRPIRTLKGTKNLPKWSQKGPTWSPNGPKWTTMGPNGAQMDQTWTQYGAPMDQNCPQMAQKTQKGSPREPTWTPNGTKSGPNFDLGPPQRIPMEPQRSQEVPKWSQWCQNGAKLVQKESHMELKWSENEANMETKRYQKQQT